MIYLRIVDSRLNVKSDFPDSILKIVDFCYKNKDDYPFLSSIDYY